ncbi:DNA polymerase V [Leeuwenhoekiella aestuarii]|uniref:DNA polymerase V n=1 Tax=Leeuwenhoekiella aestuarii TaxID=2249426 RepID=A0A4V1KPQ7_9FLAO|nr:S24 family peptidase [Leeuwenhoekiella aestuarii]RXG16242.1 DNA polymerase V [Leeuwenhoekiella aestuarii]RXG16935.1 DNA polymerase V [Leeuwenhoekiella aestuarii]
MEFEELYKIKVPDEVHQAGTSKQTGFPSPATHYLESTIDLNSILTTNRDATFFIRISGNGWKAHNILDQDVLIINRAAPVKRGKLALVVTDGIFKIERIPTASVDDLEFTVWGVITYIIHAVL